MPLDPQFRAILDTLDSAGLLPLVQGDADASLTAILEALRAALS